MAKEKKQTATLDELLEQALVSEDGQPYKVPNNWVWTNLGDIAEVNMGQSPKGEDTTDDNAFIGLIGGAADMGFLYPIISRYTKKPIKLSNKDDVIISIRATLGRPIFSDGSYCLGRGVAAIKSNIYQKSLLRLLINANEYYLSNNATGTTFAQVNAGTLKKLPTPLPPLAEQQRIVERIESLFEKLDLARELVQSALGSFETRKASILHKAFTGELTAKWRTENHVGMESWEEKSLGKCGTLERGRSKHRPRNAPELFDGPYPFIQTGDVASANVYVTHHKQTLSEIGLAQSKLFPKGTLCITIAANIGDVAILSYDSCFPDSVVGFTPNEQTDSKFIYYMMSVLQKKLEAEAPATAQKNINLKILNSVVIQLPTLLEQQEIVRILDNLFEQEQKAKELSNILDQIDLMKKSILARAFRGQLGTNDPNEESAIELLKTALSEQNEVN